MMLLLAGTVFSNSKIPLSMNSFRSLMPVKNSVMNTNAPFGATATRDFMVVWNNVGTEETWPMGFHISGLLHLWLQKYSDIQT